MRCVASHRGKALQKLFKRVVVFKVLKQSFDRHACSLENRYTTKNVSVDCDEVVSVHVREFSTRTSFLWLRAEGLVGAVEALGVHDVADLEAQTAQGGDLFGAKDAADFYFGMNAHP